MALHRLHRSTLLLQKRMVSRQLWRYRHFRARMLKLDHPMHLLHLDYRNVKQKRRLEIGTRAPRRLFDIKLCLMLFEDLADVGMQTGQRRVVSWLSPTL